MSRLTVFCPLGLSNRLRVLLSGLALAEATGREFQMLWPLTSACGAAYGDLFANPWPVRTVPPGAVADLPYISGWFGHLPDLLAATEIDLTAGHPDWLLRPQFYPSHGPLLDRCAALMAELQPIPLLQERIEEFRTHNFRASMIGVHVRRGDMLRERPDAADTTEQAMEAVAHFLRQSPNAGIFLCTDDGAPDPKWGKATVYGGVAERFVQRFGERVVRTHPRSLDRNRSEAIQDGLIDLWLLRSTDYFVGLRVSSFSEMAIFGREVPSHLLYSPLPGYRRWEKAARLFGLYRLLTEMGKWQTGRMLPFPALMRYYSGLPVRGLKRKLQQWL